MAESFMVKHWIKFRLQKSLWAQFLNSKYCHTTHPLQVDPKARDSYTWKGLLAARTQAEQFIYWIIGEGNIYLWKEHWRGFDTLQQCYPNINPSQKLLKEYIEDHKWKMELLEQELPAELHPILKDLPPLHNSKDQIKLKHITHLSQLSKHRKTSKWALTQDSEFGKKIWNPWTTPSISFFIWRVINRFLPTDNRLKEKGLPMASRCYLCTSSMESMEHIFLNCSFTIEVLNLLNIILATTFTSIQDLLQQEGYSPKSEQKDLSFTFTMVCLWFIWCSRNNAKHEAWKPNPMETSCKIRQLMCRIAVLYTLKTRRTKNRTKARIAYWEPPQESWVKFNTDASFQSKSCQAGIGGILRNTHGRALLYFLGPCWAYNPIDAEAQALLMATIIAKRKSHLKFWFELDSLALVQLLEGHSSRWPWYLHHTLTQILQNLQNLQMRITHNFREANQTADWLAAAATLTQYFWVSKESNTLINIHLNRDLLLLPFVRS